MTRRCSRYWQDFGVSSGQQLDEDGLQRFSPHLVALLVRVDRIGHQFLFRQAVRIREHGPQVQEGDIAERFEFDDPLIDLTDRRGEDSGAARQHA